MAQPSTAIARTKQVWSLLKQSGIRWNDDKVPKLAAALSYYTAVSIAPLLILSIKVIGLRYGPAKAGDQLHEQLKRLTDPHIADALSDVIRQAGKPGAGLMATVLSIAVALFGASSVFVELQDSLNTIWDVRTKPDRGIRGLISDRLLTILMVLAISLLLASSIVVDAVVTASSSKALQVTHLDHIGLLARGITFGTIVILSTGLVTVMFAALFRFLPDVVIGWKDVALGAVVTGVLFQLGKFALSFYLTKFSPGSAYGVAGSLVVLIVWVYYSSLIFYFGAEFTRAYADQFGTKIVPSDNAEWIGDCDPAKVIRPGAPAMAESSNPPPAEILVTPARAEFLHQQRYLARASGSVPIARAARRNSVVPAAASLTALSALVLGRLIYKRYSSHVTPTQTLKGKWSAAFEKWSKTAKLLGASRSQRYAATHGPQGTEGSSWADVMDQTTP